MLLKRFPGSLDQLLGFYDTRFDDNFTLQEKSDLIAFLRTLSQKQNGGPLTCGPPQISRIQLSLQDYWVSSTLTCRGFAASLLGIRTCSTPSL